MQVVERSQCVYHHHTCFSFSAAETQQLLKDNHSVNVGASACRLAKRRRGAGKYYGYLQNSAGSHGIDEMCKRREECYELAGERRRRRVR